MSPGGDVLVTGGAGFIGRHTTLAFHRAGYRVTAVDLRPAPEHLAHMGRWQRGDFTAPALLADIAAGRYETVVHQAGISDTRVPAGSELTETNTLGPLRLADACHTGGARLIYASSHSVYGTLHQRTPIAEDADTNHTRCSGPLNPYAASKLALDCQMRARHGTGLHWVGLRYTNVFGPDEADKGPMASILSQLLRQAAHTGHIRVFDDSLAAARDYIPVEIVTATIVQLAEQVVPAAVYNLGAGFAVSFATLTQWCARLHRETSGRPLLVELVPNPLAAAYQYFTCADMTALDKTLPDRPTVPPLSVETRAAELFKIFHSRVTV
ncbi:NAD-dependent epimerase/dehydratase family protein [Sphaerimonospora thailandensis]|uniref:ADP-L-glycero-D-manno-heptose-6-epimerase n=1 Tax=Sphaerimonospora thailandensis TaxID=795644 RepID=A0A8J3R9L4_9ACTN|nr:NAD-dependent epimerase/dehydratase family protein [Sphaerimonospora thailandensis]GIH69897.1 ADP-L-glycero-D-manno-heptose-6-epimerase [Sphaerimonospora thailandensis]